jgi:drug/metabolite transporter (DMT)-like permease
VLLVAGLLCTGSFLLFLLALVRGGAGAAGTLRNVAIVFALGFAWVLGERPGRRQLAGTAVVLVGAALLAWPTGSS